MLLLEIGIIAFQTINFLLKTYDIIDYDIDPKKLLDADYRKKHIEIYFKTYNFKTCLVMEVFTLICVIIKIIEISRLNK